MNDPIDGESLRAGALERLVPPADGRAREIVEQAAVAIERDVTAWESSDGTVHAHRVVLGLDARLLAMFVTVPFVREAVVHALAAAIANVHGASLLDVLAHWQFVRTETDAPGSYRDAPVRECDRRDPGDLATALAAFVRVTSGDEAAVRTRRLRVIPSEAGDACEVVVPPGSGVAREERLRVEGALVALLARPARLPARIRWRDG